MSDDKNLKPGTRRPYRFSQDGQPPIEFNIDGSTKKAELKIVNLQTTRTTSSFSVDGKLQVSSDKSLGCVNLAIRATLSSCQRTEVAEHPS